MKRTFAVSSAALLSAALLAGCGSNVGKTPGQITEPPLITEQLVRAAVQSEGVTNSNITVAENGTLTLTGELGGQAFVARFPRNWNTSAVLFAHGYLNPIQYQADPQDTGIDPSAGIYTGPSNVRETVGVLTVAFGQGYATAYSTYAKTGYAVESGIESTYRLKQFLDHVGARRAYIAGESMGGNIAVGLIEQHPNDFAGALPYCGVVAGWGEEQRYLADFRVIYDYFTKNTAYALPGAGDALTPNDKFTFDAVQKSVGALFTAASKNMTGPEIKIIGLVSRFTGAQADPVSFVTALSGNVYGLKDQLATAGGNGYSNAGKVYTYPGADASVAAALNAGVERLSVTPQAAAYLSANYTPTGTFKAKVLSLHNLVDPLVPYEFEPLYRNIVDKAGNGANLVQQVVDEQPVNYADFKKSGPGHCYFSSQELTTAWNELRGWVEQGVKPEDGKNITDKPTN